MVQKVDANPTRAFFVRMITRDISLSDCILDLIDNSIDGARRAAGHSKHSLSEPADLTGFKVEISIDPEKGFSMVDNCGGISLDDAVNYAFTFGRKDSQDREEGSIGVYGIGMKRAVFKLGNSVRIHSTYASNDQRLESFAVPIDVASWMAADSKDWDFDLVDAKDLPIPGVEITVEDLHLGTIAEFQDPAFRQNLLRIVARDYALLLSHGLEIVINGKLVRGWAIELLHGGEFSPIREAFEDVSNGSAVSIEVLAGMAAPPPESNDPDEKKPKEDRFGWYIICNGRVVLAADKSAQSVWGAPGMQEWHPQYNGFMGFVIFDGDAASLPLTTTKRNVDTSSPIYRRVQQKMREVSKAWVAYTNERKLGLEKAKQFERSAKPMAISLVPSSFAISFPRIEAKPKIKMANIAYSKPLAVVQELAEALGNKNLSYRDVGLKSFEYAYDDLVGEE